MAPGPGLCVWWIPPARKRAPAAADLHVEKGAAGSLEKRRCGRGSRDTVLGLGAPSVPRSGDWAGDAVRRRLHGGRPLGVKEQAPKQRRRKTRQRHAGNPSARSGAAEGSIGEEGRRRRRGQGRRGRAPGPREEGTPMPRGQGARDRTGRLQIHGELKTPLQMPGVLALRHLKG